MRSIRNHWLALGAIAGYVSLAACADTTNPGGAQGPVTLSFTTASSSGAALDRIVD